MGITTSYKCEYCGGIVDGPTVSGAECNGGCSRKPILDLTKQQKHVLLKLINKEMEDMEKYGRDFTNLDYIELTELKKKVTNLKSKHPEV